MDEWLSLRNFVPRRNPEEKGATAYEAVGLNFFFVDGVRFDLSYGVSNTLDFAKYKETALEALCSIKPQSRMKQK